VTEVSVFRPGSLSYLRIAAPDVARSAAFYRTVFGWKAEDETGRFEDATGHTSSKVPADQIIPDKGRTGRGDHRILGT
jgi:predicted enzyme related to lactoylglutathione lyase